MNVNSVTNVFLLGVIRVLSQVYVYRIVHTVEQNNILAIGTTFRIIFPVNYCSITY